MQHERQNVGSLSKSSITGGVITHTHTHWNRGPDDVIQHQMKQNQAHTDSFTALTVPRLQTCCPESPLPSFLWRKWRCISDFNNITHTVRVRGRENPAAACSVMDSTVRTAALTTGLVPGGALAHTWGDNERVQRSSEVSPQAGTQWKCDVSIIWDRKSLETSWNKRVVDLQDHTCHPAITNVDTWSKTCILKIT